MLRAQNRRLWTSGRLDKIFVPGHGDGTGYALPSSARTPTGYGLTALALSPQAYYKFDEGAGTSATDSTGNGHTGTYTSASGTLSLTNAGKVDGGLCMTISGSGSTGYYVATGITSTFSTFSIGGWFQWDGTASGGGWCGLFGKAAYNSGELAGIFNTSTKEVRLYINGTSKGSFTPTLNANTWYHVFFTYDGTNAICYWNGTSQATNASSAPSSSGFQLRLGMETGGAYNLTGKMDDWGIWYGASGAALSGANVAALYAAS